MFTVIDIPGGFYPQPVAINDNGEIIGYYQDEEGIVRHGFIATPSN